MCVSLQESTTYCCLELFSFCYLLLSSCCLQHKTLLIMVSNHQLERLSLCAGQDILRLLRFTIYRHILIYKTVLHPNKIRHDLCEPPPLLLCSKIKNLHKNRQPLQALQSLLVITNHWVHYILWVHYVHLASFRLVACNNKNCMKSAVSDCKHLDKEHMGQIPVFYDELIVYYCTPCSAFSMFIDFLQRLKRQISC